MCGPVGTRSHPWRIRGVSITVWHVQFAFDSYTGECISCACAAATVNDDDLYVSNNMQESSYQSQSQTLQPSVGLRWFEVLGTSVSPQPPVSHAWWQEGYPSRKRTGRAALAVDDDLSVATCTVG